MKSLVPHLLLVSLSLLAAFPAQSKIRGNTLQAKTSAQAKYKEAEEHFYGGRYDEGMKAIQELLWRHNPDEDTEWTALQLLFNFSRNHAKELGEKSVAVYKKFIQHKPDTWRGYDYLGQTYLYLLDYDETKSSKLYDEAVATYQAYLRRKPKETGLYFALAAVHKMFERHDEAIAVYEKVIQLDPNKASPYYALGELFKDLERYDEAADGLPKNSSAQARSLPCIY